MAILSFRASGNILPSRFVKISGPKTVAQAGDNEEIIGVAFEGTQKAPLADLVSTAHAAEAGQSVAVYSVGEICLVEAGGAVNAGALVRSDSQGRAVAVESTGTTIRNYGGIALEPATAAGQKIQILVMPLQKVRPALT